MYQTQDPHILVEKRIQLSPERARRLSFLAHTRGIGENQVVEKALDILFSLTDLLNDGAERQAWSMLSEASLQRVWDNEADASYDDWRSLYGVPAR
jgi:hypothetical protein